MSNEQTDADKQFHALAREVTDGYSQLLSEQIDGTITPADLKARKRELRLKEQEMKRRFDEVKKAARLKSKPIA